MSDLDTPLMGDSQVSTAGPSTSVLPDFTGRLSADQDTQRQAAGAFSDAQAKVGQANNDFMSQPQSTPPAVPKDQINKVMEGAPWMLAIAALGGKIGKIHGLGMLKSMQGVTQGLMKGDDVAYTKSVQQYQQDLQAYQQSEAVKWRNFQMYHESLKDTADGARIAWDMAYKTVGDDRKANKDTFDTEMKLREYATKLAGFNLQLQDHALNRENIRSQMVAREAATTDRETKMAAKAEADKLKAGQPDHDIDQAVSQIDDLIGQLDKGTALTGVMGMGNRALETVGGNLGMSPGTQAHDFQASLSTLRASLPGLILSKKGRDNAYVRAQIEKIAPGLEWGSNKDTTRSNLQQLKTHLNELRGQETPKFEGPNDVIAAYKTGKITREVAAQTLKENGWAQ